MKKINVMEEMYLAFSQCLDIINEKVFDNEFDNIVFLIQGERATSLNTYGVFWGNRWTINGKSYSEISLTAEMLQTHDLDQLFVTIVHELIHYKADIDGIKDTSANGKYHNKNFKMLGEQYGFIFNEKHPKIGWCETGVDDFLSDIFKICIKETNLDKILKEAKRNRLRPQKPKKTFFKFKCSNCGMVVHAKLNTKLVCGVCNLEFKFWDILPEADKEEESNS